MLIAVVGSSGLNGSRESPRTTRLPCCGRRCDSGGPRHPAGALVRRAIAKEQAHVLIAASPRTSVAVLTPRHHPLTLTLIGAAAQQTAGVDADPGLVVALVNAAVARSRSLVWYPRVWGLKEPSPTAFQLVACIVPLAGVLPGDRDRAGPGAGQGRLTGGPDRRGVRGRQQPDAAAPTSRRRGGAAGADRARAAPAVRDQVGDAVDRAGRGRAAAGRRAAVPVLRRPAGGRGVFVLRSRQRPSGRARIRFSSWSITDRRGGG